MGGALKGMGRKGVVGGGGGGKGDEVTRRRKNMGRP